MTKSVRICGFFVAVVIAVFFLVFVPSDAFAYMHCTIKYEMDSIVVDGKCVDPSAYCKSKHGEYSKFESTADKCGCEYEYMMNDSEICVYGHNYCETKPGYKFDVNKAACVTYDQACVETYSKGWLYSESLELCVQCESGYTWNEGAQKCYKSTTPCPDANSYLAVDGNCYCNQGYLWNSLTKACVDGVQLCNSIALGVFKYDASAGKCVEVKCEGGLSYDDSGKSKCNCNEGYLWRDYDRKCLTQQEYCDAYAVGYTWSGSKGKCVKKEAKSVKAKSKCGTNSSFSKIKNRCICKTGYKWTKGTPLKMICEKVGF